ncbi:carbohydrate ABC transporter permease [Paenibacillus piri]|nr:sugar ABC transporter permease [Paenibacillus piri]
MQIRLKNIQPYFFLSPYFLLFGVFSLFPILYSFYISFQKWDGFNEAQFVGLDNYAVLLTDMSFYQALLNTFLLIVVAIPLQLFTALLLAAIIKNSFKGKWGGALKLIHFLPYITTPVAVAILFQIMFDWQAGTVNMLLQSFQSAANPINWLGTVWGARFVILILVYWKYFGYLMVIVFAGLSAISEDIYEAASIDGASARIAFFKITLPLLKPVITFLVVTSIIGGIQLFDEPKLLFSTPLGGPDRSVMTIVMKFYEISFSNFNFGYGSAMAYGTFVLMFVLSMLTLKLFNRGE